jgi:hypothetical protein
MLKKQGIKTYVGIANIFHENVFHRIFGFSDPIISNFEKLKLTDSKPLPAEAMNLLLPVGNSDITTIAFEITNTEPCDGDDYDFNI